MATRSLARDTVVLTIVKIIVLLAIGFVLFGAASRPHIDLRAHLLAAPSPQTR